MREWITAVVLAGGNGERLGGCDKSSLHWRGRPFLHHIVERLAPQASAVAISAPTMRPHFPAGVRCLSDPWPDARGPLAGILAGLEASHTPWVLFAPCDNPEPPLTLAERLAAAIDFSQRPTAGLPGRLAYASCGDEHHFLFALIPVTLAPSLRAYLEGGERAVYRWYRRSDTIAVPFEAAAQFANINTPDELALLRARE